MVKSATAPSVGTLCANFTDAVHKLVLVHVLNVQFQQVNLDLSP